MKIVRPTLKILLDRTRQLDDAEKFLGKNSEVYTNMCALWDLLDEIAERNGHLHAAAKDWIAVQENRDKGWAVDLYYVQIVRSNLENALIEYRKALADVYDFMGDRGLT